MGRAFIGVELKRENFLGAVHLLSNAIAECAVVPVGLHGLRKAYQKPKKIDV